MGVPQSVYRTRWRRVVGQPLVERVLTTEDVPEMEAPPAKDQFIPPSSENSTLTPMVGRLGFGLFSVARSW